MGSSGVALSFGAAAPGTVLDAAGDPISEVTPSRPSRSTPPPGPGDRPGGAPDSPLLLALDRLFALSLLRRPLGG